ncbi:MAG: M3 family metallopeptidase [Salinivirgaceae bacterium]|jgi:peptidyl-dipeptidase Dcp|nr:M3 family metallopeptidase [Bacteroidales bacterium]
MNIKNLLAMLALTVAFGCTQKVDKNPFLSEYNTPYQVPPFNEIKNEHYIPAYEAGIQEHKLEIEQIITNTEEPTFANTIEALEFAGKTLQKVRAVLSNLRSSATNDELQEIARVTSPMVSNHYDEIYMNPELFARVKSVYENKDSFGLNTEQLKLVENTYKQFVRGGANLNDEDKEKMKQINSELSLLSISFRENVNKDNDSFQLIIDNESDLEGLPQSVRDAAALLAKQNNNDGKWLFTLDNPSRLPFLQYSSKRELREKVYKAYVKRGDNDNEYDNKENIKKILSLRYQKAQLLGYKNHAEYVLEERMAKSPEPIFELCNELMNRGTIAAKNEAAEMQKQIKAEGNNFKLEPWDWWYYAEKIRKQKFDIDEDQLRTYFSLENALNGVFSVSNKLYDLNFKQRDDIPLYHADARVYEVTDNDNQTIGILYMDFHPRKGKNGGAWMSSFSKQYNNKKGERVPPVITVVCNFSKPTENTPALLSFDEVSTLFHEFGHALHGLLSRCQYYSLSGTATPRDFVELPSQIMENWAAEPEVMKTYAFHYETGEVIPDELIEKLEASAKFNQGFVVSEFQAAALLDMYWHTLETEEIPDIYEFEAQIRSKTGLISEIEYRYRSTYFNHIFAGGYSAGYYSYTWAEILDADAFQAFKETSLFDKETANKFRTNILERGGTEDAMDMYVKFRGRKPTTDALMQRKGI